MEWARRLRLDATGGEAQRAGSDQHDARGRGLLEPRGHVHGLAGGERGLGRVDHDLAGLDADPSLEPELVHGVHDREPRPDPSLRVVLVCLGDAERRHDRVPRELLDQSAVRLDALRRALEILRDAAAHYLRIGARDERGRIDEVDEDDGRELSLHP